ncbi:MAG: DUF3386 family protein [Acidobacteria bacterium]|nr:DUF3386 family protein [Acidobacteriota bacterium]
MFRFKHPIHRWNPVSKSGCRKDGISVFGLAAALFVIVAAAGALPPAAAGQNGQSDAVSAAGLLQQARKNREVFTKDFHGFRSNLTVRLDGKAHHGTCLFRVPGTLEIALNGGKAPPVVEAAVRNMLMHRVPSSTSVTTEARYGKPDAHSLGRKVLLDDKYQSAYRIKDRQILQVDRTMPEFRRVLTVLETRTAASGKYLPRHVFAVVVDNDSGAIREAWTYITRFQEFGSNYLPHSRHVIRTGKGRTSTLLIEWHDIELLKEASDG